MAMASSSTRPSTIADAPVSSAEPDEPIDQQRDDDRAHQRLADRAAPAAEAVAAEQRRRHDREFEADAGVGADAGKPRRVKHAGEAGEHAGDDIGQAHRAPHRDAGVVGRATRSADRRDAPADAQPGHDEWPTIAMTIRTTKTDRHAEDRSGPDEVEGVGLDVARSDLHRVDLQQELDDGSYQRQHDERRQERAQPQKPIKQAIDQSDERADADRRDDGGLRRPSGDVDQRQSGEVGEREVGADAEIDAAGEHDDRHADHDQSKLADLPRGVGEISEREEIGNRPGQVGRDHDEKKTGIALSTHFLPSNSPTT